MIEEGVEAGEAGGGCMHRAWCSGSGRQARPGQGLSTGEAFRCASPAAGRAARWTGRGLGGGAEGRGTVDRVKGADGWEIQQAGEERLGVMPTLGGEVTALHT